MGWRNRLSFRVSSLFRNEQFESEMDLEMRSHFEQLVEDFQAQGYEPKTAQRLARREFGSVDRAKEECRDNWGTRLLFDFIRDLKFASRLLAKSKGYAIVCVITIAVAIAACSTIFSVFDGILLRPFPYRSPDRLVSVWEFAEFGKNSVAGGSFLDWRGNSQSTTAMMIHNQVEQNLKQKGSAALVQGWEVSSDFLEVLGVSMIQGRDFNQEDERVGSAPVVVLTEEAWHQRYDANPAIIGQSIVINEVSREVIGILPANTWLDPEIEFFIPAVLDPNQSFRSGRAGHWAFVWARLKDGVTIEQFENELNAIKLSLNPEYPEFKRSWTVSVEPLRNLVSNGAKPVLWTLCAAVGCVLLIACANVSNLVLARTLNRRSELAMRSALGATRARLMRQSLTESLLLSAAGGLLGLLLAIGSITVIRATSVSVLPGALLPTLDLRALVATTTLACGSALLFGFLPSLTASRRDPKSAIGDGEKSTVKSGQTRTQTILVIAEIALTIALLSGTGLLLKSLESQLSEDPGYKTENTYTFDLNLPAESYRGPERRLAYISNLQERLKQVPGVESASTLSASPLSRGTFGEFVTLSGEESSESRPLASVIYIQDNFFETLSSNLIVGRRFEAFDNQADANRVVVIDRTLARTLFGESPAVGQFVDTLGRSWEVVGVVEDMKLDPSPRSAGYLFIPQQYFPFALSVVVRTQANSASTLEAIKDAVHSIDSGIPLANTRTLEAAIENTVEEKQYILTLLLVFAGIAMLLATTGMYSVMAYAVATRNQEICIRKALGATRRSVIQLILKSGTKITLLGAICGIFASLGLSRLVASQLYQMSPFDLGPTMISTITIAAIGLLACLLPALKSAKLNPNNGLRDG